MAYASGVFDSFFACNLPVWITDNHFGDTSQDHGTGAHRDPETTK